jgi:hypothetical protein
VDLKKRFTFAPLSRKQNRGTAKRSLEKFFEKSLLKIW